MRILIVDDEESIRTLFSLMLGGKGHSVSAAGDGLEALALVNAGPFDVVVTDHSMPAKNGLELVRELKAASFPGRIVVFSGALSPAIRKEYEALKVDAIIAKPLGLGELVALLASF